MRKRVGDILLLRYAHTKQKANLKANAKAIFAPIGPLAIKKSTSLSLSLFP